MEVWTRLDTCVVGIRTTGQEAVDLQINQSETCVEAIRTTGVEACSMVEENICATQRGWWAKVR
jgi:hypothetical protein